MKLICFLGLTAGGIVCDLFNHVTSVIRKNGSVDSPEHKKFKGLTPYLDKGTFNEIKFTSTLIGLRHIDTSSTYFGTHTHPSNIPQDYINEFDEVYVITTVSKKCKFYKYLRYKHMHSHIPLHMETCFSDFPVTDGCIEIRFSDIVDGEFVKRYNLNVEHFENWKNHNNYLYTPSVEEITEFESLFNNYQETLCNK